MSQITTDKIRNIAIIAHVDHGKTTLIDAILKQSHVFRENQQEMSQSRILDSNELEQEKGITIQAKTTAVFFNNYKINIIDTPGHADFGGEVERTLSMADGAILLVDAQEGVMPQTTFVLKKALSLKLPIIVVINKIDKRFADIQQTKSLVEELFLEIAEDETQLDYQVLYAIGKKGIVTKEEPNKNDISNLTGNVPPLLECIIKHIPAPTGDKEKPFSMQAVSIDHNQHIGNIISGKVLSGTAKVGLAIEAKYKEDDKVIINAKGKIEKIFINNGLEREEVKEAVLGDIVSISGIDTDIIGCTLSEAGSPIIYKQIKISEPTVRIKLEPNTSPFTGKEGEFVTPKQIEQRLLKEKRENISLKIDQAGGGSFYISGRGELQLAILMESLRREGFEFQVRKPEVIEIEEDGMTKEPLEELSIIVPSEYTGQITEIVNQHKGVLQDMTQHEDIVNFRFHILTRNLIGLRYKLITATKGSAIVSNVFKEYVPKENISLKPRKGSLISITTGTALAYALNTIQNRGDLFITPGTEVYEGMIIGINSRENDIEVNPCKGRHKTGVRMSHSEITQIILKQPIILTLDNALSFIGSEDMLEITPQNIRLRKIYLKAVERVKQRRLEKR